MIKQSGRTAQALGASFEDDILRANTFYKSNLLGVISKIPTGTKPIPIGNGKVQWVPAEKTGSDFIGVFKGRAIAFEAKSTVNKTRFPLMVHNKPMIQKHQIEFLKLFKQSGGIAFVLIKFSKQQTVYRIDINEYLELRKRAAAEDRKSIPVDWFRNHQINRRGYIYDFMREDM